MRKRLFGLAASLMIAAPALAQAPAGKTLAATLNVQVFPKNGQTPDVQSKDESACYDWAVTNSGSDPFELHKQSQQQAQQTEQARSRG